MHQMPRISVPSTSLSPISFLWKYNGYAFASNNSDDYFFENLDAHNTMPQDMVGINMNKISYSFCFVRIRSAFFKLKFPVDTLR